MVPRRTVEINKVGTRMLNGWISISGDSMWPSLREGDRARLAHSSGKIRVGEVVVARINHQLVSHRVLRIKDDQVTTGGDNCLHPDPVFAVGQVLGTIGQVQRKNTLLSPSQWNVGPKRLGRLRLRAKRWATQCVGAR